jgi:hypothetical protein
VLEDLSLTGSGTKSGLSTAVSHGRYSSLRTVRIPERWDILQEWVWNHRNYC